MAGSRAWRSLLSPPPSLPLTWSISVLLRLPIGLNCAAMHMFAAARHLRVHPRPSFVRSFFVISDVRSQDRRSREGEGEEERRRIDLLYLANEKRERDKEEGCRFISRLASAGVLLLSERSRDDLAEFTGSQSVSRDLGGSKENLTI